MVRKPTQEELNYINRYLAPKPMDEDDVWVLDANVANNYNQTAYHYFLGTSTLGNFVSDLKDTSDPIKLLVNHREGIPLGTWLPGEMSRVDRGYDVLAPVFMRKDLESQGLNTDELVKAYNAGHLTDVSITWEDKDGTLQIICEICGNDIRDYENCPHIPGMEYDGIIATCTIENAHLAGEISMVWKGALPGAKLNRKLSHVQEDGKRAYSWKSIKKAGFNGTLSHTLVLPMNLETNKEELMTFKEVKEKFKDELAKEFVSKDEHDTAVTEAKDENTKLAQEKEDLESKNKDITDAGEKLTKEHTDLTSQFASLNAEANENKAFVDAGKKQLEFQTAEYHRLGVVLHDDKWDNEAKETQLKAMTDADRFKFLEAEIKQISAEVEKKLKNQPADTKKEPYAHMDNDKLYSMKR